MVLMSLYTEGLNQQHLEEFLGPIIHATVGNNNAVLEHALDEVTQQLDDLPNEEVSKVLGTIINLKEHIDAQILQTAEHSKLLELMENYYVEEVQVLSNYDVLLTLTLIGEAT